MLRRLASAIYWILSCLSLYYAFLIFPAYMKGEETLEMFFVVVVLPIFICWGSGWVIRFVVHYLTDPYKEASKTGIFLGNITFFICLLISFSSMFVYFFIEDLRSLFPEKIRSI